MNFQKIHKFHEDPYNFRFIHNFSFTGTLKFSVAIIPNPNIMKVIVPQTKQLKDFVKISAQLFTPPVLVA